MSYASPSATKPRDSRNEIMGNPCLRFLYPLRNANCGMGDLVCCQQKTCFSHLFAVTMPSLILDIQKNILIFRRKRHETLDFVDKMSLQNPSLDPDSDSASCRIHISNDTKTFPKMNQNTYVPVTVPAGSWPQYFRDPKDNPRVYSSLLALSISLKQDKQFSQTRKCSATKTSKTNGREPFTFSDVLSQGASLDR